MPTASEIFRNQFKGERNFMTPNRIKLGKFHPRFAYEVSWGTGFKPGTRIYGLTVVEAKSPGGWKNRKYHPMKTKNRTDLGGAHPSRDAALKRVERYRRRFAGRR